MSRHFEVLALGAIGIAHVMLVSVWERVIGLGRGPGSCPTAMGLGGEVIGAARPWTPRPGSVGPFVARPVGAVTGLVGGLYPALRAAHLEPVEALEAG